uniref:hypothetical protein n=1 Tax=Cupriavidus metallidurans TaxID=119219 RepID=UPI00159540C7|nr:hypothetical protein [Cupriavidus metallidurans]
MCRGIQARLDLISRLERPAKFTTFRSWSLACPLSAEQAAPQSPSNHRGKRAPGMRD